uniref:FZ domain-containing protein n=1 Tax=Anguilla anguilla TaxID=7936 RepID=A0A0E9W3K5_ANGAN
MYVPECESGETRRPCRSLCESAKQGCEPLMSKFGLPLARSTGLSSAPRGIMCEQRQYATGAQCNRTPEKAD